MRRRNTGTNQQAHTYMKKNLLSRIALITLGAAVCLTGPSCRSTIYRAARDGDDQTVRQELRYGANPNDKPSKAHLLWAVPTALVTVPVDITQICLVFGTLGLYVPIAEGIAGGSPLLTPHVVDFFRTPIEVAYDNGHTNVVSTLAENGANVPSHVIVPQRHATTYSPIQPPAAQPAPAKPKRSKGSAKPKPEPNPGKELTGVDDAPDE